MKTSLAKNTRAGNQTSVKNDSTFVKCALGGFSALQHDMKLILAETSSILYINNIEYSDLE